MSEKPTVDPAEVTREALRILREKPAEIAAASRDKRIRWSKEITERVAASIEMPTRKLKPDK